MFYTYMWLRKDGTPYYVGKGSGNRAYANHRVGKAPLGRIVIYPAESEAEAFETEVALVWYYGRKDLGLGCLRNLTDGGENPPRVDCTGRKASDETIEKLRKSHIGKKFSEETKRKMRVARALRVTTEEARKNMSNAQRGNSKAKGCVRSEETRRKMSIGAKLRWSKCL